MEPLPPDVVKNRTRLLAVADAALHKTGGTAVFVSCDMAKHHQFASVVHLEHRNVSIEQMTSETISLAVMTRLGAESLYDSILSSLIDALVREHHPDDRADIEKTVRAIADDMLADMRRNGRVRLAHVG
jgi:hypothetical protein